MTVMTKPLQPEGLDVETKIDSLSEFRSPLLELAERTATAKTVVYLHYVCNHQDVLGKTLAPKIMFPKVSLTNRAIVDKVFPKVELGLERYFGRCVEHSAITGAIAPRQGLIDAMEASRPGDRKSEEVRAEAPQRRRMQPSPELYPEFDFDRMRARSTELRDAPSISAAVSRVLRRPGRAVPPAE